MVGTLSRVTTLLFAVGVLLIGHGLQLTLLPLHALAAGWSATTIGLTGSFYFVGFAAGCIVLPSTVAAVGHIRTFMVMAAVATVALLGAALFVNLVAWIVLRGATGFALAGLYMVIESWLTDVSPAHQRGKVLSIYLIVSLIGMAVGQLFVSLGSPAELRLFVIAAIMISIAIVPIGLTRVSSPRAIPSVRFTPRRLLRASPVAVVCAILAGMVVGAFWTLGPVVARRFDLDAAAIGMLMSAGLIGGALAQYPIGLFSDVSDRRLVIAAAALFGAAAAVFGGFFAADSRVVLFATFFLICAAGMPIYALCIAYAVDKSDLTLVEVTSGILLAHSLGSVLGPMIVAPFVARFQPASFFFYCASCFALAVVWTLYRYFAAAKPQLHEARASMLPRTTQAVAELAPTTYETNPVDPQ